jgi:hypothetical protein
MGEFLWLEAEEIRDVLFLAERGRTTTDDCPERKNSVIRKIYGQVLCMDQKYGRDWPENESFLLLTKEDFKDLLSLMRKGLRAAEDSANDHYKTLIEHVYDTMHDLNLETGGDW